LFSEEVGLVMEVDVQHEQVALQAFAEASVECFKIGQSRADFGVEVNYNGANVLSGDVRALRDLWESTSFAMEFRQTNAECVRQEQQGVSRRRAPAWRLTYTPTPTPAVQARHKVAVIRQEGSNGDREMCSAFDLAGFEAWDVHMSDLLENKVQLSQFRGVVFVGGFSYADVLDSAKGWAGVIKYNPGLTAAFEEFYNRKDTFSLGVCNGCQLMALLGWIPFKNTPIDIQPRFIHNKSGRFESRFVTLTVQRSNAIMLQGMEGSSLGVWVAHGEGRVFFPEDKIKDAVLAQGLAPLRYVDDDNKVTQEYPFNPNGAMEGIAGMCSADGRHLALMPHPERVAHALWQWPYLPEEWRNLEASPWLRFFQNARTWCDTH